MARATESGWQVKLIDIANCFNPQLIGALHFNNAVNPQQILQNISLARPFQFHQASSIIKQLPSEVDDTHPQLIIVTDISAQFFDPSLVTENKQFPVAQLELLRHVLGVLQGLATQGHMIIITEQTNRKESLSSTNATEKPTRVHVSSLSYASKIHLRIKNSENERQVLLLTHPCLPPTTSKLSSRKDKKPHPNQTTLSDWYHI
jgi:RecA/RadA recombinase